MRQENSTESEIEQLREELREKRKELVNRLKQAEGETVENYRFQTEDGVISLEELFGEQEDLIIVHNMGTGCPYCTMWADGFNGEIHHLEDRAAFVVVSPDPPEEQKQFSEERGWDFRMVSAVNNSFTEDMGFAYRDEGETRYLPGVSTFHRSDDGSIQRVARDRFGPGDLYSAPWHLFGLLKDGMDEWHPKFQYK